MWTDKRANNRQADKQQTKETGSEAKKAQDGHTGRIIVSSSYENCNVKLVQFSSRQ